jgi:hypothetical protein
MKPHGISVPFCANTKRARPKATLLLRARTQLRGAGTVHRRISWISPHTSVTAKLDIGAEASARMK